MIRLGVVEVSGQVLRSGVATVWDKGPEYPLRRLGRYLVVSPRGRWHTAPKTALPIIGRNDRFGGEAPPTALIDNGNCGPSHVIDERMGVRF